MISFRWPLLWLLAICFWSGFARAQESALPASGAIVVGDRVVFDLRAGVGAISPVERAQIVNARLKRVLAEPDLRPESLEITLDEDGQPLIGLPDLPILSVTAKDALRANRPAPELAERWATMLRKNLSEAKPLYRAEAQHGISVVPLLIVAGLAFGVPILLGHFKRFPLPVVVGEIILGMVVGRSGFDLIRYDSWLQFLAEFGFAFLMFLSGLEVDVGLLIGNGEKKKSGPNPLQLALLIFGLTLLLAFGVAFGLTLSGQIPNPWLMSLVLSTTSLGLVVPILKERELSASTYGPGDFADGSGRRFHHDVFDHHRGGLFVQRLHARTVFWAWASWRRSALALPFGIALPQIAAFAPNFQAAFRARVRRFRCAAVCF